MSQDNTNSVEETDIADQQFDRSNLVDVVIVDDNPTSTHIDPTKSDKVPCDNANVSDAPPLYKRVYKRKEAVMNTSESSLTRRVKKRVNRKPSILLEGDFIPRQASKSLVDEKVSLKGLSNYCGFSLISIDEKVCIEQFLTDPRNMSATNYRTTKSTFCIGSHLLDVLDGKMVSGDVLEVAFELLDIESKAADRAGFYCLFSYVYPQTKLQTFPDELSDEMKKKLCDCFNCPNYIFGIVNYYFMILLAGSHWHLFIINFQQSRFQSYNSLNSSWAKARVLQWSKWVAKYFDMSHKFENMKDWEIEHVSCPQQSATSLNCRLLYILKFAQYLSEGKGIFDFGEEDMARIRAEYVAMILCGTTTN